MNKSMLLSAIAAATLAISTPAAQAAPLTLDAGWTQFQFGSTTWADNFTFSLSSSAYLYVTDAFLSGDMFEVFSSGASLGQTSLVPDGAGFDIGNDFDAAFASADFSSAVFMLGAGVYDISGTVIQSAAGTSGGGAGIQIVSAPAVPVPAAGLLLLSAFGGVAAMRRRKKA